MLNYTKFRYCPKCAHETLVPLHNKAFECQSCAMKYYHNTASAVGCIIITPKGLLLVVRAVEPSKGLLDIPGGFSDYNESLEDALRREIREELSIEIVTPRYLVSFPNVYTYFDITYFTTDAFFITQWDDIDALKPNDEIVRCEFINPKHIDFELLAFESTKNAIKHFSNLS